MRHMAATSLALASVCMAHLAWAGGVYPPLLPPEQTLIQAMLQAPGLVAAHEQLAEGTASGRKLRAGPHEWEVALITQQRKDPAGLQYHEQEYELQRRFRTPGKGGLDSRLGALTEEAGELAYADSWHEAGRTLVASWFEWQRSAHSAVLAQQQAENARRQFAAVSKRVAAGDAARIEGDQADTEFGNAQAAQLEALRKAEAARLALLEYFPALDTSQVLPATLPDPPQIDEGDEVWIKRIVAENHEIELAQSRADQAQLLVQRAGLDRIADPTLGLAYSKSIDGNIDMLRLRIAIPLGYAARDADVALARSSAKRAQAAVLQAHASVEAAARTDLLNAHSSYRQWQRLSQVARQSQNVADSMAKAYAAGEAGIAALLRAQRQAQEAQMQSLSALLNAHETYARLRLDAHEILTLEEHPR